MDSERPNAPTAAGLNSFHSPARSLFRKRNANERLAGFFLIIVVVLLLFLARFVIWHLALVLLFHVLFCCFFPPRNCKNKFFPVGDDQVTWTFLSNSKRAVKLHNAEQNSRWGLTSERQKTTVIIMIMIIVEYIHCSFYSKVSHVNAPSSLDRAATALAAMLTVLASQLLFFLKLVVTSCSYVLFLSVALRLA